MILLTSASHGDLDEPLAAVEEADETSEHDLWFLSGPIEDKPDDLPPGPRAEPRETAILDNWRKAEASSASRPRRGPTRRAGRSAEAKPGRLAAHARRNRSSRPELVRRR